MSSLRRRVGGSEISMGIREEIVMDRNSEKEVYEGELHRLRKENENVKEILNRSLKELKAYQVKFPTAYGNIVNEAEMDSQLPLFAGSDAIAPLMKAYDNRVKELEDIVTNQMKQMETIQEQMEDLISENNDLRKLNVELAEQSNNKTGCNPIGTTLMDELVNELNERIEILMSENGLLVEQKMSISDELDKNMNELSKRTMELNKMSEEFLELQTEYTSATQTISLVQQERDTAVQKIIEYSNINGKIESQIDNFKTELAVWQQKSANAEHMITDLKSKLKEQSQRFEEDGQIFFKRTKNAEDRVVELHSQLLQKGSEFDDLQEVHRKMQREYNSTRTDAEGMLQVMSSLERQVAEFTAKENKMNALVKESKVKIEEALRTRDQAVARDIQNQKEIARLLEERKKCQIHKNQEIEEAVEKVRVRFNTQIKAMESEMNEIIEKNSQLRVHGEKATREHRSIKDTISRINTNHEEYKYNCENVIKGFEERMSQSVTAREEETRKRILVQEQNTELRANIDTLRVQIDSCKSQHEQLRSNHEVELIELRSSNRDIQKELNEKQRLLSRKTKEYDELHSELENKHQLQLKEMQETNVSLRKRLNEIEKNCYEMESLRTSDINQHATFIQEMKSKHQLMLNNLDSKLKEIKIENDRLIYKQKELDNYIHSLTEDKYATTIQNTELKNKVIKLQEELVDTQSLLSDLNLQLANQCEDRVMNVISSGLDKENHLDDFNRSNTFNNSIDMD